MIRYDEYNSTIKRETLRIRVFVKCSLKLPGFTKSYLSSGYLNVKMEAVVGQSSFYKPEVLSDHCNDRYKTYFTTGIPFARLNYKAIRVFPQNESDVNYRGRYF